MKMNISKQELANIMHLAWPAVVQEAMSVVVSYVDTAMVGALGASASAAIGLTGTVNWLTMSICLGFGVGVLAVIAKADGAKDYDKMPIAGAQAFYITLIVGSLLMFICVGVSPYLPIWLNGDISIQKAASTYFFITSLPFIFKASSMILASALRGVSDMKSPMFINIGMNIINIVLNFFLIYPTREIKGYTVYGAGLGVTGAAIATAIAFVVGGIVMFIVFMNNQSLNLKKNGLHYNAKVMKECLKIGIPVVAERSVICFGHVAFSSLIASLGVIPFAAHTIAIQAEQAFYIPGYGFQSSEATLVGNAMGEKNEAKVYSTTYIIAGITAGIMTICGLALFILAPKIMTIFTPDAEVVKLGASVLRIVALSEPIFGILTILEGTFNGMGDTKAPFIYAIITMWIIRVGGSYLMINVFNYGLKAVWIMMVADNVVRWGLLLSRFIKGTWKELMYY